MELYSMEYTRFQGFGIILLTALLVSSCLFAADQVRVGYITKALEQFSVEELRGLTLPQYNEQTRNEIDRLGMDEIRRRVELIEDQMIGVRLAVIESQLNTLFWMGQILVGAVVVYLVQVVMKVSIWFGGRSPK